MIPFNRFEKNIGLAHLALISGNEDIYLKIIRGLLVYFPNRKDILEHYCFDNNFGKPTLESEYDTIENLYNRLIDNEKELLELGFIDTSYVEEENVFTEFTLTTEKFKIEISGDSNVEIHFHFKDWIDVPNCKTLYDLKHLIRLFS